MLLYIAEIAPIGVKVLGDFLSTRSEFEKKYNQLILKKHAIE